MTKIPYAMSQLEARDTPRTSIGDKAANLVRIGRSVGRVPPWFAVTTDAFATAIRSSDSAAEIDALRARLADEPDVGDEIGRQIRQAINALVIPTPVADAIAAAYRRQLPGDAFVAVRSSAIGEDSTDASYAGLHDSLLFVRGENAVLSAVRAVWASAYNARALAFRRHHGMATSDIGVGVVVQEMVDATLSGVVFTVDPTTGGAGYLVVSSVFGAGEGLVSAGFEADTFRIERESLEVESAVVTKDNMLVFDDERGTGLARRDVPVGQRRQPTLQPGQLRQLASVALAIEREYRFPQDIEFCFDAGGALHVVQARPITTGFDTNPAAGNRILWDNSNIIESYSGVTSPMTFSFIRHAYSIVYECFCEVMGIAPHVVRANRRMFRSMLGLIRGQVYYNLMNWHRLVKLFPGYDYNRGFMESMMGVRDSVALADNSRRASWAQRYFSDLPALVRLVARSSWNFARMAKLVQQFEAHFESHYGRWEHLPFDRMPPEELLSVYREMEETLLRNWKTPIINDFYVMIFYGVLKKLCVSWVGDEAGTLQNDLLCGEGDIQSTEPMKELIRIAAHVRRDAGLAAFFREHTADELAQRIPKEGRFAALATRVQAYLDRFGFRCADELKLEEPSLKDRPAYVYQVIRNYLDVHDESMFDLEAQAQNERRVRADAEARAFAALKHGGGWRIPIFRCVLVAARRGVKNRENMRFARTRIYGTLRQLLRGLGASLTRADILAEIDDVFYLTLDEVDDFVHGTAVSVDLRALVQLRRAEFAAYRQDEALSPDDRFTTHGMVYHQNRFRSRRPSSQPVAEGVLRGTGCCPGVVTGPVKVILSLTDDTQLAGEILVASRTDPGWVTLYPSVSGILIERGSILSHSAIVAREMGIPTIVGIPGITSLLESGQQVTMDAAAGTVRILTRDEAQAEARVTTSAGTDSMAG